MAYPPAYDRAYSFTDYEVNFPGQPKPGDKLDTEFDAVSNALTATQDSLALIQRADGALANDSVGEDQLQDGLLDGIVDGVTADAEAAAAAAAASASAAAGSAAAAATAVTDATTQAGIAAGSAAAAGVSQGIAQSAATDAADFAAAADTSADVAVTAATSVENSVAAAQLHEEMAFKWAEYLAAPVMPAPPGWPEAVDDGMFSAKWWALRARDYNEVHEYDFGTAGTNPGEAFDIWDLTNDLEDPPGLVYMTWGTPPRTYVLTDPSDPSDPNSWMDITGADGPPGPLGPPGPPGPPNTLTIGTVTTGLPGSPAAATITGAAPNQTLNMTIPAGADGAGTTLVAASGTIGLTAVAGAAATAPRSDSTPALSQAIAPTWTGLHVFNSGAIPPAPTTTYASIGAAAGFPGFVLSLASQALNEKLWWLRQTGKEFRIETLTDDYGGTLLALSVLRSGANISVITFGNPTSNPAYNFLGTGTATFNGTVDLLGPLHATSVAGVPGQVLSSKGPGIAPEWRTSSGGSIELGYNFSTSVSLANPGSQKMSMNSAVYASVTFLTFNSLAMTNFDANTILSLLAAGNRIYIQARADATRAVVYEVTGPGTQITGAWNIPVAIIQSRGALFAANADLNCVFILSVSSSSLANPTALVGLTPVNGTATTGLRSDGAPALNQAITPTWSGSHTFTNNQTRFAASAPYLNWAETGAVANSREWLLHAVGQEFRGRLFNDAMDTSVDWINVHRSGVAVTSIAFGNAANNPVYNFLGTGVANFGGVIRAGNGTAALPAYSFANDNATGIWIAAGAQPRMSAGGFDVTIWAATFFAIRTPALTVDGSAALPGWSFENDPDTGFFRATSGDIGATCNGIEVLRIRGDALYPRTAIWGTDGSAAAPAYSFNLDQDTGMYSYAANVIGFATAGVYRMNIAASYIDFTGVPQLFASNGVFPSTPAYTFAADPDTGMYRVAADWVGFLCGGAFAGGFRNVSGVVSLQCGDGTVGQPFYTFTNDSDTGVYRLGANQLAIAVGAVYAGGWEYAGGNAQYLAADGSAGLPAISFQTDKNTGFYAQAADVIGCATGGVLVASIHSAGITAASFTTSSSRAIKRETGSPSKPANILARLRPIMYRLLAGDDSEQLGLIAEEVHEVCPQLSDGKSVSYDRLALLLLAAWQEEHLEAA